jgi:hypothetical protein
MALVLPFSRSTDISRNAAYGNKQHFKQTYKSAAVEAF